MPIIMLQIALYVYVFSYIFESLSSDGKYRLEKASAEDWTGIYPHACTHRLPTRENAVERYIPVLSRRWPRAG